MFAHPLDLIMIYLGNICSNVPMSVLSLINVSELEMGPSSIISHFVAVIALLRTI